MEEWGIILVKVTRLDGSEYWLNPHQIEIIEMKPDTIITLLSGRKLVVKESPDLIINCIVDYRRKLGVLGNEE